MRNYVKVSLLMFVDDGFACVCVMYMYVELGEMGLCTIWKATSS